jgi:hypothetical protein
MKTFKKVAASLLALTMSVSLFACGGEGNDSSSQGGLAGLFPEGNLPEGDGAKYLEGAVDAFNEAETITVEIDLDTGSSSTQNTPYYKEPITSNSVMDVTFKATLAKTENGFNVAMEGTANSVQNGETISEPVKMYIVDSFAYNYDYEEKTWDKASLEDILDTEGNEAMAALAEIYATITAEDADFSPIFDVLGPIVEEFAYIEKNKYNFTLNLKEDANKALTYLANMDYTQTLETYLNSVLTEFGSEKTVKDILDEVGSYGAYTVGEAYADLNEILVNETGKNVKGIQAELVAKLETLDFSLFEEYISAEELEQFNAIIAQIKATDVDALIQPYAEVTVDELVVMLMASQGGDMDAYAEAPMQTITLKSLTDMIYTSLKTQSLQQTLYSMGLAEIMQVSEQAKYISVSDLSEKLSIKFDGFKFSSMEYEAKVGGSYNNTAGANTASISANISMSLSCKVNFSKKATTITAPKTAI